MQVGQRGLGQEFEEQGKQASMRGGAMSGLSPRSLRSRTASHSAPGSGIAALAARSRKAAVKEDVGRAGCDQPRAWFGGMPFDGGGKALRGMAAPLPT